MRKFGHDFIVGERGKYFYVDTGEEIPDKNGNVYGYPSTRLCPKCKNSPTKEGHDPCISNLPGVKGACCGHGVGEGYMRFTDDRIVRGVFKIEQKEETTFQRHKR